MPVRLCNGCVVCRKKQPQNQETWCQTQYHEGLHGDEQRETQTINTRQVMKGEETGGNTAGTNDETKKVQMNIKHTRHDTIKIKQELINTDSSIRTDRWDQERTVRCYIISEALQNKHTKLERIIDTFYFNLLCALAVSNLLVSAFRASSSALFFPSASWTAAFLLNGVVVLCTLSHACLEFVACHIILVLCFSCLNKTLHIISASCSFSQIFFQHLTYQNITEMQSSCSLFFFLNLLCYCLIMVYIPPVSSVLSRKSILRKQN